jgi:hypothetical protein
MGGNAASERRVFLPLPASPGQRTQLASFHAGSSAMADRPAPLP